ncbi:MAG: DNA replication/repair protein RecF [Fusobacteria bacterium]|nr:DNA replication/repair protein RecF [Fusobacteriota bacterium]
MYLTGINYLNIRNLISAKCLFSKKINFFYGKNGQGKTSLIEAIYFGITGKSFRTSNIKNILKYNAKSGAVFIQYTEKDMEKNIALNYKNGKKEYFYNKNKIMYDEFFGKINVISFIPDDINLIMSSPSTRRNFFDYEISQSNFTYYSKLKEFNQILKIRNKYIKERKHKTDIFKIYNDKFIEISSEIMEIRYEYINKITVLLNLNYRKLFNNKTELYLKYIPSVEIVNIKEVHNIFQEILNTQLEKDLYYGYTSIGPQKDDFMFLLSGLESKNFSSEGEKRSVIFALKIAEIDMIIKEKKEAPIFLIDDIISFFDSERQKKVIEYFKKRNMQLFITSTEKIDIDAKFFKIEEGVLYEEY